MRKKEISENLKAIGIQDLNEMQKETLSVSEKENDILLLAPTGSGKTIAYLYPLLLNIENKKDLSGLIILPSRELAIQVFDILKSLKTSLNIQSVYGGHKFETERNRLITTPNILIGTPGRILDHLGKETVDLSNIKHIIFDEFDKSLEFGFLSDIERIYAHTKDLETHFLTSATKGIEIPEFFNIQDLRTLDFTEEKKEDRFKYWSINFEEDEKTEALLGLISTFKNGEKSIVFCNHREAVERVMDHMNDFNIPAEPYHGGLEQRDREKAIIKFRNKSSTILVATDLAARGLDIEDVDHIIHYQNPSTKEVYIHRNGRASRNNLNGQVYLFSPTPDFVNSELSNYKLPDELVLTITPEWSTLFISKGKKDKVNKVDILGFLCQTGRLNPKEIGKIDVKDKFSYVAIKANRMNLLLKKIRDRKIKNKVAKFRKAR